MNKVYYDRFQYLTLEKSQNVKIYSFIFLSLVNCFIFVLIINGVLMLNARATFQEKISNLPINFLTIVQNYVQVGVSLRVNGKNMIFRNDLNKIIPKA